MDDNRNLTDQLRNLSGLMLKYADDLDKMLESYNSHIIALENRLTYEERKNQEFIDGLKDLVNKY